MQYKPFQTARELTKFVNDNAAVVVSITFDAGSGSFVLFYTT